MIAPDYNQVWKLVPDTKLETVVDEAQEAFWRVVAEAFPEVKTGDFPPDNHFEFHKDCKRAIAWWLYWNHPESQYRKEVKD